MALNLGFVTRYFWNLFYPAKVLLQVISILLKSSGRPVYLAFLNKGSAGNYALIFSKSLFRPETTNPENILEGLEGEPLLTTTTISSTNDSAIAVEPSETATRTGQTTSTVSALGDLPVKRPQNPIVMHETNRNNGAATHGR